MDRSPQKYDVFISYNSSDKSEASAIKKLLERMGFHVWFDEDHIEPGSSTIKAMELGLRSSLNCLVLIGKNGRGPWQTEEIDIAIVKMVKDPHFNVIPIILPDIPKADIPEFLAARSYIDLGRGYLEGIIRLLDAIQKNRGDNEYSRKELMDILKNQFTTDNLHELAFRMGIPFVQQSADIENIVGILEYAEKKDRIAELIESIHRIRGYARASQTSLTPPNTLQKAGESVYVSSERRIRVQVSNICNLNCPECHWDEFEKDRAIPHYDRVIRLIENIKKDAVRSSIQPRPQIAFTLTGGEPLFDKQSWEKFASAAKVIEQQEGKDINTAFLLTNASLLDRERISIIKREELRRIRISLNYRNGQIEKKEQRLENIKSLLREIDDIEVRFNHVIRPDGGAPETEILMFRNFVQKEFKEWIPKNIKGIGFIQEARNTDMDIFSIAAKWCEVEALPNPTVAAGNRKSSILLENGLLVEFIKLNCDLQENFITRCFDCIQEKDIAISIDGRVRICSGWNQNWSPRFKYAYIDIDSPLAGISGVIRRQYGMAGFFGHFAHLINRLESGELPRWLPQRDNLDSLTDLLKKKLGCYINNNTLTDALVKVVETVLAGSSIRKLYEEGLYSKQVLEHSTQLCEILLGIAYTLKGDDKIFFNTILLILIYLTVDESLFSGKTIIIKGLAERLLKMVVENRRDLADDFLLQSTHYIATIASENITPNVIDRYIDLLIGEELQNNSCEISYIKGWIYSQPSEGKSELAVDKAISAFERSYTISQKNIRENQDLASLYKEIRADSQRSLGALKKSLPERSDEARKHFLLSRCLGAIDETQLRYMSLFSDGYSSLLRYFENEYGRSDIDLPEDGYRAYMYLSDSIFLNRQFYASLIRIALLDLAFDKLHDAKDHLLNAQKVFARLGLLTDQEYLNSILCLLALLYATYKLDTHTFDIGSLSQVIGLNVEGSTGISPKDIKCVRDDTTFLLKIMNMNNMNNDSILSEIEHHTDNFIKTCTKLYEKNQGN